MLLVALILFPEEYPLRFTETALLPLTLSTRDDELEFTVAGFPDDIMFPVPDAVILSVFDIVTPYLLLLTFSTLLSPPEFPGLDTEMVPLPGLAADMFPLPLTLSTELMPETLETADVDVFTLLTVLPDAEDDAISFLPATGLLPFVEMVPDEMLLPPLLP